MFFLTGVSAQAESQQPEDSQIQVTDDADILSDSEERRLTSMVDEMELSVDWDIMVVSVSDTGGKTSEEYAEEWFDEYTTDDDGVICLIDMGNHEMAIRTFGEVIDYVTDERLEAIFDDAYQGASEGDYFSAYESMLHGIDEALQRGIPDDQYTYDEDTEEVIGYHSEKKRLTLGEILLGVVAALVAGGITIGAIIGKYRLKWGSYQYSCRENGSVELTRKSDQFVNQIVTHRRIPKNDSPGGSGGGGSRSTTHVGAGGRRSGGGSRKF